MVSLDVFGLSVHILTFQLHVKDLNETIRYMYEHKMYQKVMSVLGAALGKGCEGGSRSRAHGAVMGFLTLDWLCFFFFFFFEKVSFVSVLTSGLPGITFL